MTGMIDRAVHDTRAIFRRSGPMWLAVLGSGVGLWGCQAAAPRPAEPLIALEPCPPAEEGTDFLCGHLDVLENRKTPSGRTIRLKIVVLPALSGSTLPDPMFVLAGGPGQAATELADVVSTSMRRINRQRDIVLVDQRGTGSSSPLECQLSDTTDIDESFLDPLSDQAMIDLTLDRLRGCLDGYDADPTQYVTPVAMDDVDEVRAALGYDRINLWGGSYGTRAALVYMRRHPDHVRSAVLDGVAPPALKLPVHMGVDARRALDLLLEDCAADTKCAGSFPHLRDRLESLLTRLDRRPARADLRHPRTGQLTSAVLTRATVASLLRSTLYSAELSAVMPLSIQRASEGDFQPLVTASAGFGFPAPELSQGMFFSVICAEDVARITPADRTAAANDRFWGAAPMRVFEMACQHWPQGTLPADYFEPHGSEAPTLLFSGELDPVTPPRWGESVARNLPHALHVVVPGVGHGTLGIGCVPKLIAEFVDRGSVDGLNVSCVDQLKRPPFFIAPGQTSRSADRD